MIIIFKSITAFFLESYPQNFIYNKINTYVECLGRYEARNSRDKRLSTSPNRRCSSSNVSNSTIFVFDELVSVIITIGICLVLDVRLVLVMIGVSLGDGDHCHSLLDNSPADEIVNNGLDRCCCFCF